VWISGHVNENSEHPKGGMVMDFTDVKSIIQPIIDKLDHHHLGEGYVTCFKGLDPDKRELVLSDVDDIPPGFIPTSENLLIWIAGQLPADLNWQCLALSETCTSEARLYANDWAIQKHIDAAAKELANDNCPF
jgi:6-pyruvoyl-tetrahydropterin synthase